MAVHPDLREVADLLGIRRKEAGEFCSEVAWHVTDRLVTYAMIAAVIDAHPRVDPTPEMVAGWIMASPFAAESETEDGYVDLEFDPGRGARNVIQRHDFRDAVAGIKKCPHGIPITQRCRICRPAD